MPAKWPIATPTFIALIDYLSLVKYFLEIKVQVILVDNLAIVQQPDRADNKQLNLGYWWDVVEEIAQHCVFVIF